jgi:hypothetical protein
VRRLHLLSGSKLHLASLCAASARPDYEHTEVGSEKDQRVGNGFHAAVRNWIATGSSGLPIRTTAPDDPIVARVDALYDAWRRHYALRLEAQSCRAEVTYAFDAETRAARILGQDLDRKYVEAGLRPTEIPVTVDMVCRLTVYDWKTGIQRNRQPIGQHAQLRAGGFLAARCAGESIARIVVSYVDDDGITESDAVLDEFDFTVIEEELVARYHAATSQPEPRPGPHCADLWCGAIASCPAVARATEAILAAESAPVADAIVAPNAAAIRSPEQAAKAYVMLRQIDALSVACWRALDAYVDANGPVDLGNGTEYAAIQESRDAIRLDDASEAAVREMLGEHGQGAIKRSLTKEAIKEATKAMVGGGKVRVALEREVMATLESLGAVRVSSYVTHQAVKKKEGKAA